jgi:drug/metabolite transporter (DMT)-like permease
VLVFITMLWGSTFLILQTALRWSGPLWLVSVRFGLAAVLLAMLSGPRRLAGLNRLELRAGLWTGVVMIGVYGLQTAGLQQIASSKSAFLTALYVPAVPLMIWFSGQQAPDGRAWAGIAAAFGGMVLLTGAGLQGDAFTGFASGDTLTLGAALLAALEIVLISRYSPDCDPRRLALVQTAVVAIGAAVAALWHGEALPSVQTGFVLCVGALALMSAFIQFAMSWAQQTVPATHATLIYALEPVWAGLIGVWVGERFGWAGIGGAALILLGIVIGSWRRSR